MRSIYYFAACSAVVLALSIADPSTTAFANTQSDERSIAAGAWTGKFLQRDWTFELKQENGEWSGQYMRSDTGNWHPLNDLVISGLSVSFSIESKPQVSFALEVDKKKANMSGAVTIDGVATIPFSAARKS